MTYPLEPNLPPTGGPAPTVPSGGAPFPTVSWRQYLAVGRPATVSPAPAAPVSDFSRLADAVTALYQEPSGAANVLTPQAVAVPAATGGMSPGLVLGLGVVAAVLGYLVVRWAERHERRKGV